MSATATSDSTPVPGHREGKAGEAGEEQWRRAAVLALGTTAGSVGGGLLLFFSGMGGSTDSVGSIGILVAQLGLIIGPSIGYFHDGRTIRGGFTLGMRAALLVGGWALVIGGALQNLNLCFTWFGSSECSPRERDVGGDVMVGFGIGLFAAAVGSAVWDLIDISTTEPAETAQGQSALRLTPIVVRAPNGLLGGVGLTGSF